MNESLQDMTQEERLEALCLVNQKIILLQAMERIDTDKNTFSLFERNTKGHIRALIIIDEMVEQIEKEGEKYGI